MRPAVLSLDCPACARPAPVADHAVCGCGAIPVRTLVRCHEAVREGPIWFWQGSKTRWVRVPAPAELPAEERGGAHDRREVTNADAAD